MVQLSESDQEQYKNFPLVVSERWQEEVSETVFDYINQESDKSEQKRKQKELEDLELSCKFSLCHVLFRITAYCFFMHKYMCTCTFSAVSEFSGFVQKKNTKSKRRKSNRSPSVST